MATRATTKAKHSFSKAAAQVVQLQKGVMAAVTRALLRVSSYGHPMNGQVAYGLRGHRATAALSKDPEEKGVHMMICGVGRECSSWMYYPSKRRAVHSYSGGSVLDSMVAKALVANGVKLGYSPGQHLGRAASKAGEIVEFVTVVGPMLLLASPALIGGTVADYVKDKRKKKKAAAR